MLRHAGTIGPGCDRQGTTHNPEPQRSRLLGQECLDRGIRTAFPEATFKHFASRQYRKVFWQNRNPGPHTRRLNQKPTGFFQIPVNIPAADHLDSGDPVFLH
jgi:hypothetical protein